MVNPMVKQFLKLAVAAVLVASAPLPAQADNGPGGSATPPPRTASAPAGEGWYVGASAGLVMPSGLPNRNFAVYTPSVNFNASQGYGLRSGLSAGVQGGYQLERFRVEGEVLYQNMSRTSTSVTVAPVGGTPTTTTYGSASVNAWSGLVNGYYDFNRDKKWSPYIGVGVGFTNLDTSQAVRNQAVTLETPGVNATVFAYQAKAGLSYNVNERTSLFLQYRYLGTAGFTYGGARVTVGSQVYNVPGISNSLSNSSIELGGRFRF